MIPLQETTTPVDNVKDLLLAASIGVNLLLGFLEIRPKKETADAAILGAANSLYTNLKAEMDQTSKRLSTAEAEIIELRASIVKGDDLHRKELQLKDSEIKRWQDSYLDQVAVKEALIVAHDAQLQLLRTQLIANNIKPFEFVVPDIKKQFVAPQSSS